MEEPNKRITYVDDNPPAGQAGDRKTRVVQLGGSKIPQEINMYLSVKELEQLLVLAKASPVRRVVLERVGINVNQFARPNGETYEVWKLTAGWIRPDRR